MEHDGIFRLSFFVLGVLTTLRYVTWPLYILGAMALIFNKFKPLPFLSAILLPLWYLLTISGVLLILGFLVALITMPTDGGGAGIVFYGSFLASLPLLIPSVLAAFFKPK